MRKSGASWPIGSAGLLLAVALWLLLPAFAADAEAVEISGQVTMNGSRPVDAALVRVYEGGTRRLLVTRTDQDGRYRLGRLAEGRHVLEVEVRGQLAFRGIVETRRVATNKNIDLVGRSR